MLDVFHTKLESYVAQKWKNGGGETREIARDDGTPFRWRLSLAKVAASGPFSAYPGYERTIVLLSGGPVTLTHNGKSPRPVALLSPCRFKGEWETKATVESPSEDFNVFAREGEVRANVHTANFHGAEELQFPLMGREHFLFGVDGEIELLEANGGKTYRMLKHETLRFSRRGKEELLNVRAKGLTPRAVCLWVVLYFPD